MMEALHRPAQRYGLDVLGQRWPDGVLENVVSHQMLTDFPRSGEGVLDVHSPPSFSVSLCPWKTDLCGLESAHFGFTVGSK